MSPVRSHFLACFWQMAMYSSTSSLEPIAAGALWWMLSGWMSRMFSKPVEAMPPACSMMKAMGLHSYSRRSFEREGREGVSAHEKVWKTHRLVQHFSA